MYRGRRVHDWGQSGSHMALLANINRDRRRSRALKVSDFVPRDLARYFRQPTGIGLTRKTLHALKPIFKKDADNGT